MGYTHFQYLAWLLSHHYHAPSTIGVYICSLIDFFERKSKGGIFWLYIEPFNAPGVTILDFLHYANAQNQYFCNKGFGSRSHISNYTIIENSHLVLYFSSLVGPTTRKEAIFVAVILLKGVTISLPKEKSQ